MFIGLIGTFGGKAIIAPSPILSTLLCIQKGKKGDTLYKLILLGHPRLLPTAVLSTTKGLCKKQAAMVQFVDKPMDVMCQVQPEILFSPLVLNMYSSGQKWHVYIAQIQIKFPKSAYSKFQLHRNTERSEKLAYISEGVSL